MSIMFAGTEQALANMSVPRHQILVDAIAAGDPDHARAAVDEHMREAADTLIADLRLRPAHQHAAAARVETTPPPAEPTSPSSRGPMSLSQLGRPAGG
jgi:hypothetical protein